MERPRPTTRATTTSSTPAAHRPARGVVLARRLSARAKNCVARGGRPRRAAVPHRAHLEVEEGGLGAHDARVLAVRRTADADRDRLSHSHHALFPEGAIAQCDSPLALVLARPFCRAHSKFGLYPARTEGAWGVRTRAPRPRRSHERPAREADRRRARVREPTHACIEHRDAARARPKSARRARARGAPCTTAPVGHTQRLERSRVARHERRLQGLLAPRRLPRERARRAPELLAVERRERALAARAAPHTPAGRDDVRVALVVTDQLLRRDGKSDAGHCGHRL